MPIALLEIILNTALGVYTSIKGTNGDTALISKLLPVAFSIYNSLVSVNSTLAQAQAEAWTDNDPRWLPVFAEAHKAIAAAQAAL